MLCVCEQLRDPHFRRHILIQFLIALQTVFVPSSATKPVVFTDTQVRLPPYAWEWITGDDRGEM